LSNTFASLFKVTTWGESHGPAMGAVIDGCPAGVSLSEKHINDYLKKANAFHSFHTARREENKAVILSGIYKNKTLGTPISLIVFNKDADSSKYLNLEGIARPSHAEYAYYEKYGFYDPRGGARASGRECVARHLAAAIAEQILKNQKIVFNSKIKSLAGIAINKSSDMKKAFQKIESLVCEQDSSGGVFEIVISGVPAGIGEPIFNKLTSQIGNYLFSIGGIKAVEIGDGAKLSDMRASEANDILYYRRNETKPSFKTNHCGGISGGITNGAPIVITAYVKPTPSIGKPQQTIDFYNHKNLSISLQGRFDGNFTHRAMAAAASMLRIMIVDNLLLSGIINPCNIKKSH